MSTTTKDKLEEVAGLDEDHETTLIGDDLAALTPVEDETSEAEGATEGFEGKVAPQACGGEGEGCVRYPPCVSRVIDAEGKSRTVIVLGSLERREYLGTIIGLIDSASENDVIDITIVANVNGEAGTMSQRSLLSAMDRCKGHVITRAGALTTVGDVAIWLAGDEPKIPKMGAIFMRQPVNGFGGDLADYESKLASYRESYQEFSSFLVERGLVTEDEMNAMYEDRGMIAIYGKELQKRVANLKPLE